MPERYRVTCIHKNDRQNPHERITHIGGMNGNRWELKAEDAIEAINAKKWAFYVIVNNQEADVLVVDRNGRSYLTTTRDSTKANNLLSLPECP